jgi:hypothetical protein
MAHVCFLPFLLFQSRATTTYVGGKNPSPGSRFLSRSLPGGVSKNISNELMPAFCLSFSSEMRRGMIYVGTNLPPPNLWNQFKSQSTPANVFKDPKSGSMSSLLFQNHLNRRYVGAKARRPTPQFQSLNQSDYVSKILDTRFMCAVFFLLKRYLRKVMLVGSFGAQPLSFKSTTTEIYVSKGTKMFSNVCRAPFPKTVITATYVGAKSRRPSSHFQSRSPPENVS